MDKYLQPPEPGSDYWLELDRAARRHTDELVLSSDERSRLEAFRKRAEGSGFIVDFMEDRWRDKPAVVVLEVPKQKWCFLDDTEWAQLKKYMPAKQRSNAADWRWVTDWWLYHTTTNCQLYSLQDANRLVKNVERAGVTFVWDRLLEALPTLDFPADRAAQLRDAFHKGAKRGEHVRSKSWTKKQTAKKIAKQRKS